MKATRRFEKHSRYEASFWQIEQDGAEYSVRWGRHGTDSEVRTQRCLSAQDATAEIDRLAMNLADLGFTENRPATSASLAWSPELEAVILRNPTSVTARQVYGDWLQTHGNPLGELVALQTAGVFTGAGADVMFEQLFGTVAKNFRTRHSQRAGDRGLVVRFQNGFVDSIWCGNGKAVEAAAALEGVLASPASCFVRSVTLGLSATKELVQTSQPLIDVLVRHSPRLIERLEVADFTYPRETFDLELGMYALGSTMMSQAETGSLHAIWHRSIEVADEVVFEVDSLEVRKGRADPRRRLSRGRAVARAAHEKEYSSPSMVR